MLDASVVGEYRLEVPWDTLQPFVAAQHNFDRPWLVVARGFEACRTGACFGLVAAWVALVEAGGVAGQALRGNQQRSDHQLHSRHCPKAQAHLGRPESNSCPPTW